MRPIIWKELNINAVINRILLCPCVCGRRISTTLLGLITRRESRLRFAFACLGPPRGTCSIRRSSFPPSAHSANSCSTLMISSTSETSLLPPPFSDCRLGERRLNRYSEMQSRERERERYTERFAISSQEPLICGRMRDYMERKKGEGRPTSLCTYLWCGA